MRTPHPLNQVFHNAAYELVIPNMKFSLRILQKNWAFEVFCKEAHIERWAIISAFNPFSIARKPSQNMAATEMLKNNLSKNGYQFLPTRCISNRPSDAPEEGFFIYNISLEQAKLIGSKFLQNVIVYGTRESMPELIWLVPHVPFQS